MKKAVFIRMIAFVCLGVFFTSHLRAQDDKSKRPSPPATAKGTVNGSSIMIDYSSPSVKGRKIWGGLVPYDQVWRAGANEATIFSTSKDIEVEGKKLPAGKYSLFMKPGEKEWTVYFNSQTGQWGDNQKGEANMDASKTVLQVNVKPKDAMAMQEKLTYNVSDKGFDLVWDKAMVFVAVK
jgi:hypothetical protein